MDNRAMELTLARMAKDFLPYRIDQRLLLRPDMRDGLPEGHWARFVDDLVEPLDRNAIDAVYQSADDRGRRGSPIAAALTECARRSWHRCSVRSKAREVCVAIATGPRKP
jgi:hypothetical protein